MTGSAPVAGSDLIRSHTSKPVMSGRCTSRMTRSTGSWATSASASSPVRPSVTTWPALRSRVATM